MSTLPKTGIGHAGRNLTSGHSEYSLWINVKLDTQCWRRVTLRHRNIEDKELWISLFDYLPIRPEEVNDQGNIRYLHISNEPTCADMLWLFNTNNTKESSWELFVRWTIAWRVVDGSLSDQISFLVLLLNVEDVWVKIITLYYQSCDTSSEAEIRLRI